MRASIRGNVRVIVAVVITAALVGGGPSIAAMVFDARNADKVDGIHARKFVKKAKKRRNKLVATNRKGFLPNNIIRVAPNARKLAGIGPTGFWRKTESVNAALLGGLAVDAFALASHNHDADYVGADEVFPIVLGMDGDGSLLDADLLDGLSSGDFAGATHTHSATEIVSGTFDDARLAAAIARDAEVFGIVLAADGSGSGLDADSLDGLDSGAFALDSDLNGFYTQSEADVAFVEDAGDVLITAAPGSWQTPFTVTPVTGAVDPAITYGPTGTSFAKTALTPQTFSLYPQLPAAVYGKRMTLKGVELCYDADDVPGAVTVTSATANVVGQDGGAAPTTSPFPLFSGVSDANCNYTEFVSPVTLDADDGVNLQVVASWTTPAAPLKLGRVTFVLTPTDQNASAPT